MPEAAHELFAEVIHAAHRGVPHKEDLARWRDEVQRLVLGVEGVHDGEPAVLVRRGELELLAVVPCLGAGANLLNRLDGNYARSSARYRHTCHEKHSLMRRFFEYHTISPWSGSSLKKYCFCFFDETLSMGMPFNSSGGTTTSAM